MQKFLADFGRKEIALAEVEMPGLMQTREEFVASLTSAAPAIDEPPTAKARK